MARKRGEGGRDPSGSCCADGCCDASCACQHGMDGCRVEAVVSVDARGQMVLPKELRARANIGPDQKLALVSWSRGSELCCLTLQRAEDLAEMVRRTYGPLLSTAIRGK